MQFTRAESESQSALALNNLCTVRVILALTCDLVLQATDRQVVEIIVVARQWFWS
jgi:hypothetical protein